MSDNLQSKNELVVEIGEEEGKDSSDEEPDEKDISISRAKSKDKAEALNQWQKLLKIAATAKNDIYMNSLIEEFIKSINNNKLKKLNKDFRNAKDVHGNALIHYLARHNFQICIQNPKIVDLKTDCNLEGYNGMAPVHFAARYGVEKITTEHLVTIILNSMENPLQQDKFGNTVLHHSILNADSEIRRTLAILLVHMEVVVGSMLKTKYRFKDFRKTPNFERYDGLHLASEKGYTEVIDILMREGKAEAKYQNKQQMNPLHIAAKENKADCVDMILKLTSAGKDAYKDLNIILNQEDEKGNSPLCIGIEKKYDEVVHLLLDKQKEVGFQRKEGLMNFCAKYGNIQIMADLYGFFKLTDNEDINVDYPLHFAIEANNKELVELLIKIGANINRNIGGKISVEVAIEKGHADIVNLLLEHKQLNWKAISFKKNERQINLLHYAVRSGNSLVLEDLIKFLTNKNDSLCKKMMTGKDHEEGNTPLHIACKLSSFLKEEVERFVEFYRRENIKIYEMRNDNGHTPLHLAAISGNIDFVKALCTVQLESEETCFDVELVEVRDVDDNKAVHSAATFKHPDILQFLLTCSQDHKPANSYGKTPLHCASESGTLECVEKILEHVEEKNRKSGSKKVINVDNKDSQGNTSLHLASKRGFGKVVKRLLECGGDIMIVDQKGRNALQLAIEKEQEHVVEAIIDSRSWMKSLRTSYTIRKGFLHVLDTPMRLLIRSLPNMAERVLDRCKEVSLNAKDQREITTYNYEFLEDTFKYKLTQEDDKQVYKHVDVLKETHGFDKKELDEDGDFVAPYTNFGDMFVSNHTLMVINEYKQQNLLQHHVTRSLINRKWNHFGKWFYTFNFLFYCCFLGALTTYVQTSLPYSPVNYPFFYQCNDFFRSNQFSIPQNQTYILPDEIYQHGSNTINWNDVSRVVVIFLTFMRVLSVLIGHELKIVWDMGIKISYLFKEFFLLLASPFTSKKKSKKNEEKEAIKITLPSQNLLYFFLKQEWALYFDGAVYLTALYITFSYKSEIKLPADEANPEGKTISTYLRTCDQWQVGAITITLAWINLLVYMRQLAMIGKYIIILNDIINTFLHFVVIFVIFIIAFTCGFHQLLSVQEDSFDTFWNSFIKTMIMMSGEFDYGDIFAPESPAEPAPFPGVTYFLFIVFFILLALLLLNLLVGLSVNDVNIFVEIADLKKMSMRLKFVLNMEQFYRQWSRFFFYSKLPKPVKKTLVFLGKIFPALRRITTSRKEKDLTDDNHLGKMWKEVISDNIHDEKKNDITELKEKTDAIEERVEQMEKDILNTMKLLREMDYEARKNDKERKKEIQETLYLIKEMEENREIEKEERKKEVQETMRLIKLMEERREIEKKENELRQQKQSKTENKRIKSIEDNVGEILDLLRKRRSELDEDESKRKTHSDENKSGLPSSHYIVI